MENQNFETLAIRTQTERSQFDEHSTPLYLNTSSVFQHVEIQTMRIKTERYKFDEHSTP